MLYSGYFSVSSAKIVVFGIRNKMSWVFALHGLIHTHPSMAANLLYLSGSLRPWAQVLTSFVPPIHYQSIRMCIWKQWKLPKTKERNLVKLGIPKYFAHMAANSRKGYLRTSNTNGNILCRIYHIICIKLIW